MLVVVTYLTDTFGVPAIDGRTLDHLATIVTVLLKKGKVSLS